MYNLRALLSKGFVMILCFPQPGKLSSKELQKPKLPVCWSADVLLQSTPTDLHSRWYSPHRSSPQLSPTCEICMTTLSHWLIKDLQHELWVQVCFAVLLSVEPGVGIGVKGLQEKMSRVSWPCSHGAGLGSWVLHGLAFAMNHQMKLSRELSLLSSAKHLNFQMLSCITRAST